MILWGLSDDPDKFVFYIIKNIFLTGPNSPTETAKCPLDFSFTDIHTVQ